MGRGWREQGHVTDVRVLHLEAVTLRAEGWHPVGKGAGGGDPRAVWACVPTTLSVRAWQGVTPASLLPPRRCLVSYKKF